MIDIAAIKAQITDDDIIALMDSMGIPLVSANSQYMVFPSCCHHADWEHHRPELWFYTDSQRFHCWVCQYDFTKKDEGKIEPLCEEYTKSFPICTTTTDENGLEWRNIDIGAIGKKINELVEAVNRLEEEINEMGQS